MEKCYYKRTIAFLYVVYILLNAILSEIFFKSNIAQRLFPVSGADALLGQSSKLLIVFLVILMATITAMLMTFIYRNLLKFIFNEHSSWRTINFCYLLSVMLGAIVAIFALLIDKTIDVKTLSVVTNATSFASINLIFYLLNRNLKDQVIVFIVSAINISILFVF